MKVSIKEAAKVLGVFIETLRRWEKTGKIRAERTFGGHRRYDISSLNEEKIAKQDNQVALAYARVSTNGQKSDLKRQALRLENYCAAKGWHYEIISDLGSGLNYQKRGLKLLIKKIVDREISRLVLTHKDRLLRFGAELIFALCEHFNVEVVLLNSSEELSFEQELAQDVLEIITVFSARLYGSRSHKNKKIVNALKAVVDEIYC
jgi:excisionase family DNA binding protein